MKQVCFILLLVLMPTQVLGSNDTWDHIGNGGWVVARKLKDQNGKYQLRAWMVDYKAPFFYALVRQKRNERKNRVTDLYLSGRSETEIEHQRLTGLFDYIDKPEWTSADQTVLSLVLDALIRLQRLDPELVEYVNRKQTAVGVARDFMMERGDLDRGSPIYGEYTGMVHFGDIDKSELSLRTEDFSAHLLLPRGLHPARLRPVAVQDALRFGERNYLQVSPKYLKAMDIGQTAILVMHELLYSYAYNKLNHRDSNAVRALNAYVFSAGVGIDSVEDYTKYKTSIRFEKRELPAKKVKK